MDDSTLASALPGWELDSCPGSRVIGVLPGEGIGPEVIGAALDVLDGVAEGLGQAFEVRVGGAIGLAAKRANGNELPTGIVRFCRELFGAGGALLCGPGGGRFVYELRATFDLYCKLTPVRPLPSLAEAGVLQPRALKDIDILFVRENVGGIYFGESVRTYDGAVLTEVQHRFGYDACQVERVLRASMRLASRRRRRLAVVVKPGGVPSLSELWLEQAEQLNSSFRLQLETLEVDNACYQVVANASEFDVVVAPNLFGDVVADAATVVLGSRGVSYSASFGDGRRAVYQTSHGAAYDLAGTDRANPIGQIQSLAMLLQESFGLGRARRAIERAIECALSSGWRTADVMAAGCELVGTRELGQRIAELAREELRMAQSEPSPSSSLQMA